jgi:hypothetical protein
MAVWVAREPTAAKPSPAPTVAFRSTLTKSGGRDEAALTDQLLPGRRYDLTIPVFRWWPKRGTREWIEYDFGGEKTISRVDLYWFEDTHEGGCRLPSEWTLLYQKDGRWKSVEGNSLAGTDSASHEVMEFSPVQTDGLRLEVELTAGFSAGLYEWVVD